MIFYKFVIELSMILGTDFLYFVIKISVCNVPNDDDKKLLQKKIK